MRWNRGKQVAAVLAVSAMVLSGCGETKENSAGKEALDSFGYQLSDPLVTTNAGSNVGDSLKMQRLSGRVFPGVFVPGPSGQRIPNTDLMETQVLPGPQRQVVYTISDKAVFSDGEPVTCDDYTLAYTAGANPHIFSSHMPQMQQVEQVDCQPGAKEFTVVFEEGKGGRWRELFGAGTVLPAHAIARKLGMDKPQLTTALQDMNEDVLTKTADVWRYGFTMAGFDPELQVSFGPYRIEGVGEGGEVTLVPNENYYGDPPELSRIVVWPPSKDSTQLQDVGALMVADLNDHNPEWFHADPVPDEGAHADDAMAGDDPNDTEAADEGQPAEDGDAPENHQELQTVIGEMTDTLVFADAGPWATKENRQALSKCIDNRAVAEASSRVAGIEVPVSPVHVLNHNDPLARRLGDIANPHIEQNIEEARSASGLELRVGYATPSPRMQAMVEEIKKACEPAGITVTDVAGHGKTRADLMKLEPAWNDRAETEPIDAYLGAVDPMSEYDTSNARSGELRSLRTEEQRLWDEVPSIPLSAQPRTFVVDKNIQNVVVYTGPVGIGWNMDRWLVPGL
nr:ABC-type oligopeptide transport system, periplasmic component [Streptococcus thermophilus]